VSISPSLTSTCTIEAAAKLFNSSPSQPTPARTVASHRQPEVMAKDQRAMALRLEQLRTALSDTEPGHTVLPGTPAAVDGRRKHGTATLLLTGILSALFGAGLMWMNLPSGSETTNETVTPRTSMAAETPVVSVATPAAISEKTESSDEQQVASLLKNWRQAWTQRDTANYLSTYSKDFAPADGSTRDAWVAGRQKKLSAGAAIDVQVSNLAIEPIDDSHFKASFRQDYASGNYRETARAKTMLIAREEGSWRITREWQEK
jgi:hypothetical protein